MTPFARPSLARTYCASARTICSFACVSWALACSWLSRSCRSFFDSETNQAAGLVARYPHPDYGEFEQPGAYWAFGDLDARLDKAPPALGQHSIEILAEVGFPRDEIERLVAVGVVYARGGV